MDAQQNITQKKVIAMPKTEVAIVRGLFGKSPFMKHEIEHGLITDLVLAAETRGKKLEDVELPSTTSSVDLYHTLCSVGFSPMRPGKQVSFPDWVEVTQTDGVKPTLKLANWIRKRLRPAIESGQIGESFAKI